MELQYFKITVEDFEMAQNHFENEKHLGEFIIALFWFYKTDKYPESLSKPVAKYFKVYHKTAKFIQSQRKKRLGKVNLELTENQTDSNIRLTTNPVTEMQPTQQPKVNISKDKLSKVNISKNKSKDISEFDKQIRTSCKNYFIEIYIQKNQSEYYWTAKDATNMNQLIDKIKFKVKEKYPTVETNEADFSEKILSSMRHILIGIKDNWIQNNFNFSIINSKFNEIYSQIKLNPNGTNHPKESEHKRILENALKFISNDSRSN